MNYELVQKLLECSIACEDCAAYYLNENNASSWLKCINLNHDCADICLQAVSFLKRNSETAGHCLILCEKICRLCAAEWKKHDTDYCKKCITACIACADTCGQYALFAA